MFKQKNFRRFDGRTYLKTVVYVAPEAEVKAEKKSAAKKTPRMILVIFKTELKIPLRTVSEQSTGRETAYEKNL